MSFHARINQIKLILLKWYLGVNGYSLGLHGSMFGDPHGPLVIGMTTPTGATRMTVASLNPGELFDHLDDMPDQAFAYKPWPVEPFKTQLRTSFLEALTKANRAIAILKQANKM